MPNIADHVDVRDLPDWYLLAPNANTNVTFIAIGCDLRNTEDRSPFIYWFCLATLFAYHIKNDGWVSLSAATGVINGGAAGEQCVFVPQRGPRGTFTTGGSTTVGVISTALPAAVGVNQLANRGDGRPFKVRIIHNSSGGAGTTEEAYVTANTSGTTPTLTLSLTIGSSTPLASAVASGDSYEFLSGRFYMLGSGNGAGVWKAYDVLTNSMLANLGITNLIATVATESNLIALDELHVPATNAPGQGYLLGAGAEGVGAAALIATATSGTTLTGQAAGGDSSVLANEYRNFQIRIVSDAGTPTSAGQRRKITSHTAGASPIYTVPTWTVTPSATAQYVIENANEILYFGNSVNTYTYAQDAIAGGQSADTWSTTTYANRPATLAAGGSSFHSFAMPIDAAKTARYSYVYSWRGGPVTTLDLFDIAGGTNGVWTSAITYGGSGTTLGNGTGVTLDPLTGWCYMVTGANLTSFFRFDPLNHVLEPWTYLRWNVTNPAQGTGTRVAVIVSIDPVDGSKQTQLLNYAMCSPLPSVNLFACPIVR